MRDDAATPKPSRAFSALGLEQRMLLDAAAASTAVSVAVDDASLHAADGAAIDSLAHVADMAAQSGNARDVVFIDVGVTNYQKLLENISPDAEVFFIDPAKDGVKQMVDALDGAGQFRSIQVYSHGANGELFIGNTTLVSGNLDSRASELARIGAHIEAGGDLLLFGCNIAGDQAGRDFIDRIATITGADVAASDGLTGSASANGNWALEYNRGDVTAQTVIDQRVQELFGATLTTGWTPVTDFSNSDNANLDEFGWSVAVSDINGYIVAGGYAQQDIYVYRPTGGGVYVEDKITPPTRGVAGISVDIDGNFVIIGYGSINRVYIYQYTGGTWVDRTAGGLSVGTAAFGTDVAIQADGALYRAVIGAPTGAGTVYTYYSTTAGVSWTAGTVLTQADGRWDGTQRFGTAVAIDGNDVVIGMPGWGYQTTSYGGSTNNTNVGRAYIYNWTTGNAAIDGTYDGYFNPDGVPIGYDVNGVTSAGMGGPTGSNFGSSVDISYNPTGTLRRVIMGAPDEAGNGEAYTAWNNTATWPGAWSGLTDIVAGLPAGAKFGQSVAIDAYTGRVAVGAYGFNGGDGEVLTYTNGGTYDATFAAPGSLVRYGWSVALAKDLMAAGSPWFDTDGVGADKNGRVNINIQNLTPVANADATSITESASTVFNVLANDTDPNDKNIDPASIIYVTDPTKGTVTWSTTAGTVTYDTAGEYEYLRAGVPVNEVLTYTAVDGGGETANGTFTVTITGQNDAPVAGTGIATQYGNAGGQDGGGTVVLFTATNPISSQTLQQLGTFVDPDIGDTFSYLFTNGLGTYTDSTSHPGFNLAFSINAATGAVTFSPTVAMIGFTYTIPGIRVSDGTATVDLAAFNVTIARTNTHPTATVGTLAMTAWEDNIKPGTYSQAGTVITVTSTAHGLANGSTVTLDFLSGTAADSSYVITGVTANTFTVTDLVSRTTSGDVFHSMPTTQSITAQFTDPDSVQVPPEALTYQLIGAPGWVSVGSTTGLLTLSGTNADVTGVAAAFTVRATDQYGLTADKAISMTLTPTNDAPTVTGTVDDSQAYLGQTYLNTSSLTALLQLPVAYSGTYSQTGTTVTVTTASAHNLVVGSTVTLDYTSGAAVDATYTVASVISATQFTVTDVNSATTSGNMIAVLGSTTTPLFTDMDRMTPNTFTLSATFVDGTPLNGTAPIGGWLRFDGATGRFYTASAVTGSIGTVLAVRVTATDNGSPPVSSYIDLNIYIYPAPNTSGGLVPSTPPTTSNQAGYAVAVSEDGLWMAVGEPGYDSTGNGNNRGEVKVYNWSGAAWGLVTTLAGPATDGARYGFSLDWNADATRLVVGAPGDNALAGRVYAYTRAATTFTAGTVASYTAAAGDQQAGDNFGYSVALNRVGDQFVVGAPGDDAAGTEAGAVYIYTFNTAAQLGKSTSVVDAADAGVVWLDRYGSSVDFDGNVVVIGSPFDSSNGLYFNGAATVRGVNAAGFTAAVIKGTGAASYDMYGWDVGLDIYQSATAMVIAVGAPGSDLKRDTNTNVQLLDSGAVYTYRTTTMTAAATQADLNTIALLAADTAYDGHAYDRFGISVDIDVQNTAASFANDTADNGIRMVVGSNVDGSAQGAAYVFRDWSALGGWSAGVSPWIGQKYLQNNTGITTTVAGNQYGWDVAVANAATSAWNAAYAVGAGARVAVGAPSVDLVKTGTYSQAGTVITVTSTAHGYLAGQLVSLDFTGGASPDGTYLITSVAANTFTVTDWNSRTTSGNVTATDGGAKGAAYSASTAGTPIETAPTPHSAVVDKLLYTPPATTLTPVVAVPPPVVAVTPPPVATVPPVVSTPPVVTVADLAAALPDFAIPPVIPVVHETPASGSVSIAAQVHLFDDERDWTFVTALEDLPVDAVSAGDDGEVVVDQASAGDADLDSLLFLLRTQFIPPADGNVEGGDGKQAPADGKPAATDKPAGKPDHAAKPVEKVPASAALSRQLDQVGTRHQQQAKDLLERLLHA